MTAVWVRTEQGQLIRGDAITWMGTELAGLMIWLHDAPDGHHLVAAAGNGKPPLPEDFATKLAELLVRHRNADELVVVQAAHNEQDWRWDILR